MKNISVRIGPVLSCLLALMVPGFGWQLAGHHRPAVTPSATTRVQQLAQDDSNAQQPDQPDYSNPNGDNSNQPYAQPGDQNGDDSSQAAPQDDNNPEQAPDMNANPNDSGGDNGDQNNPDSNGSDNSDSSGSPQ